GSWTAWRWNANLLDPLLGGAPLVLLGLAAWALSLLPFRRQPRVLLLWLGLSGALVALYYTRSLVAGQMRHHGMLFVAFLLCVWIARVEGPRPRGRPVAAVAVAVRADAAQPFSGGPGAAAYLKEHGLVGNRTLVGVFPDFIAPPLLAPLGKDAPQALFLQTMETRSYVRWTVQDDETFHHPGDVGWKLENASRGAGYDHVVLVMSVPTGDSRYQLLDHVGSLSPGDEMYVYELTCGSACPPRS